jgi:hypothetical protein
VILTLISLAAIAAATAYLGHWRTELSRRDAQTWDSIVSKLRPDWNSNELSGALLEETEVNATPEEKWNRVRGAAGLCAMLQNSQVMLEMADYAARNGGSIDRELLSELRNDAMQIRMRVLAALVQYAFTQLNESICANALRAAQKYTGMTARMTELLQVNPMSMTPAFGAASL